MASQYWYPSKHIFSLQQSLYVIIGNLFRFLLILWPGERSLLQALLVKDKSILIPKEHLQHFMTRSTEQKQRLAKNIELQFMLNYRC